jgi:hypothetical protein
MSKGGLGVRDGEGTPRPDAAAAMPVPLPTFLHVCKISNATGE